jgi:hypothetical protein
MEIGNIVFPYLTNKKFGVSWLAVEKYDLYIVNNNVNIFKVKRSV